MNITAKMRCALVEKKPGSDYETVRLDAVYSDDPANPNHQWSKWTPSGSAELSISNPVAQGVFKEGQEYLLTFAPVEE